MKYTDWQQIEPILATVLELPEEQRPAQIEQLCAGNSSLRNEVLSLLAAHNRAGSFLEMKTQISSESAQDPFPCQQTAGTLPAARAHRPRRHGYGLSGGTRRWSVPEAGCC